jgi:hypothetical protein
MSWKLEGIGLAASANYKHSVKLCQGAVALDHHVVGCHCEQKAALNYFPSFPKIRKVTITAMVLCSKSNGAKSNG